MSPPLAGMIGRFGRAAGPLGAPLPFSAFIDADACSSVASV